MNRQHYIRLDEQHGDTLQSGDIYLINGKFETAFLSHGTKVDEESIAFRPVSTPSDQMDKLTVWDEYAKSALDGILANPSEQSTFHSTVGLASEYADAMMKARAGNDRP